MSFHEFSKEHFNIAIDLKIIDAAWQGVTTPTLNSASKNLWPDCIAERDFEGFDPQPGSEVVLDEIVSLEKQSHR